MRTTFSTALISMMAAAFPGFGQLADDTISGAAVSAAPIVDTASLNSGATNSVEAAARSALGYQEMGPSAAALATAAQALLALTNKVSNLAALDLTLNASQIQVAQPQPEEIQITASGAIAQFGPHVATLSPNINVSGSAKLLIPSRSGALELRTHVIGLFYYSPQTGESVALATLQDSVGEFLPPNRVTYRNSMTGSDIDISYTYTKTSFEQDLVLRKQLPDPKALGFDAASVMLAVITELLDPPPVIRTPETIDLRAKNLALGVQGLEELHCESLFIGSMRILGTGKAFLLGDSGTAVPTGTSMEKIDGRYYLIESTPYSLIRAQIDSLPSGTLHASIGKKGSLRSLLAGRPTPTQDQNETKGRLKNASPSFSSLSSFGGEGRGEEAVLSQRIYEMASTNEILLAKSDIDARPGVVLDYQIVSSPLLNLNCGGASPEKTGFAAVGQTTNDVWTTCLPSGTPRSLPNLKWSDNSSSSVGLVVSNASGGWGNGSTDPMYNSYLYNGSGTITLTLTNLPNNVYNFYVYGHAGSETANSTPKLFRAGTQLAYKGTTIWGQGYNSTNWEPGLQYQVFSKISVTNQTIRIDLPAGGDGYSYVNGLQVVASSGVPPPQTAISNLINVDFAGTSISKTGYAAVGLSSTDFWNGFPAGSAGSVAPLTNANRTASTAGIAVQNAPGGWGNGSTDPMYNSYMYPSDGGNISITLTNLAPGNYDFYLYGHAGADNANTILQLWTGDRNCGLRGTTIWGSGWNSTNWDESQQFVVYHDIDVETNQPVTIIAGHNATGYAYLNGLQIVYKGSADTNSNGLSDAWEIQYFGNFSQTAAGDFDSDYLTNIREYHVGYDPTKTSSDGSGVSDSLRSEFVWCEDTTPIGSYQNGTGESWSWTNSFHDATGWGGAWVYPYSGSSMHMSAYVSGSMHQHYFTSPDLNFLVNTGEVLIAYVNLDSTYPPTEIMLKWYVRDPNGSASWEHRAYWGANTINEGTDGTASRYHVGSLPSSGTWVRLEVPASAVGLEGRVLQGISFMLWGGRAAWDRAGKFLPDLDMNGLLDAWERQYFNHIGVDPTADPDYDGRSNLQEFSDGTSPTNAVDAHAFTLALWRFDNTNTWAGSGGQLPMVCTNVCCAPGVCTNSVLVDNATPTLIGYREAETNGAANINCRCGTVRYFFKPRWSSTNAGGVGPGSAGRMLEVGSYNASSTNGWWAMLIDPGGNNLSFATASNGTIVTNVSAPISWTSNQWHQVALTYAPTGTSLYLDLSLAASGTGISLFPTATERKASGLKIGADGSGANQAKGSFDELETFNYPLTAPQISGSGVGSTCTILWGSWNLIVYPEFNVTFCSPDPSVSGETANIFGTAYGFKGTAMREGTDLCSTVPAREYMNAPISQVDIAWFSSVSASPSDHGTITLNPSSQIRFSTPTEIDLVPSKTGVLTINSTAHIVNPVTLDVYSAPYPSTTVFTVVPGPSGRLAKFSFESSSLVGDGGQTPLSASSNLRIPSAFGQGLNFVTTAAQVTYPSFQSDAVALSSVNGTLYSTGTPNIRRTRGTILFWFKPNWNPGSGPANGAVFLDMIGWSWALRLNATATAIEFATGGAAQFSYGISGWHAGEWHQLAVTYDGSTATFYVDGLQKTSGNLGPATCLVTQGFRIGSDGTGAAIGGILDELETYNKLLSSGEILSNYQTAAATDSDGDGISNLTELANGTNPYDPDSDSDGVPDNLDYYPLDATRWQAPPSQNPNDTTAPTIQLIQPVPAHRTYP